LLLLAGRVEPAAARLAASDPLGVVPPKHPGPIVWPYLLVASAPVAPDAATHLGKLFAAIDHTDRWYEGYADGLNIDPTSDTAGAGRSKAGQVALTPLLPRHRADHSGTPEQRQHRLAVARDAADRRIDAVVGNKHRGAYQRVAVLAVAYAEDLTLAGDPSGAAAYVAGVRGRYPRHVAFRTELDHATRESPLLSAPPPRRR
jgi:hypothetical protein